MEMQDKTILWEGQFEWSFDRFEDLLLDGPYRCQVLFIL